MLRACLTFMNLIAKSTDLMLDVTSNELDVNSFFCAFY